MLPKQGTDETIKDRAGVAIVRECLSQVPPISTLNGVIKVSDEPVLDEREREKIELEETLRHNIRKSRRGRFWWLNTPIVIWLLSAVVAGLIPYSYSEYQKRVEIEREERNIRRQAASSLLSEVGFRIAQFNKVLEPTVKARQETDNLESENITAVIENNRLSETGTKLQTLFSSAAPLRVTAELGGIYAIPRTDEHANVWIGGSGWGNSHLPDGRGYRDEKYVNDSLLSLWKKYKAVTGGEPLSKDELSNARGLFEEFESATTPNKEIKSLPRISSNGLTMRQWAEGVDRQEVVNLMRTTTAWIEGVESSWTKVRELFPNTI